MTEAEAMMKSEDAFLVALGKALLCASPHDRRIILGTWHLQIYLCLEKDNTSHTEGT